MNPYLPTGAEDRDDAPWFDRTEDVKAPTCLECFNEVAEDGDLCEVCAKEEADRKAIDNERARQGYADEKLGHSHA